MGSKKATIQAVFGEKHQKYINNAIHSTISVAEGAVRAGKTIDNITAFAYMIDKGVPDRIHLATGSTSANAKLNIGDANGYGLEYIFRGRCHWTKYKGNDALVIRSHGRNYVVIFAGGAKADSYKKIRGNSYGMWIATEINLHHESTIKEAFNRQLAAKVRRIFWDLNPVAPADWIYTDYIDRFPDRFGDKYTYEHFTIRDNATISPKRLQEIVQEYDTSSIWYKRDILGERCLAEGLVYSFGEENIVDSVPDGEGEYYVSCDYGTLNPFSAGLWKVQGDSAVRIREYYYSGRSNTGMRTDEEYADEVVRLCEGVQVRKIVVDPSAASFIACLRKRKFTVLQADNSVLDGIRLVARYLRDGNIKIHRSCTDAIAEFGQYSWDTDAAEDKVIKQHDHAMDDIRYFCMTVLKNKVGKSTYRPLWLN